MSREAEEETVKVPSSDNKPTHTISRTKKYYKNWRFYVLAVASLFSALIAVMSVSLIYAILTILFLVLSFRIIENKHIPKGWLNTGLVLAILMEGLLIFGTIGSYLSIVHQ